MQVTPKHYAQAWYEALKQAQPEQVDQISQRMLSTLQMDGKLAWLNGIVDIVQSLEDDDNGIIDAQVRAAHLIPQEQIDSLVKDLLKSDRFRVTVKEDKDLLGGVVIKTKDKLWDISMKKQLTNLNTLLKS